MLSRELKLKEDRVRQEYQCDREDELIKQQYSYDMWHQAFKARSNTKLLGLQQQTDEFQKVEATKQTIQVLNAEIDGF